MRRTTGIVAFLIVIVAFFAGIAIGLISAEISGTSKNSTVYTGVSTVPPVETTVSVPPTPGILTALQAGRSQVPSTPSIDKSATPGGPTPTEGAATPGTSPIDTLKP